MWKNFFFPHPENHKKAHLISWQAILVYILLFVSLQLGFKLYSQFYPGVLGIDSEVNQQELIKLTNEERTKKGLPPLKENGRLNLAAVAKAQNMFDENYWAHYSPSGKDPWGFINASGYKFSYAGENLARNFYRSTDIVDAWMVSPTHRENILNSKYQEIGIAVVEGVLNGQKTILVVQEFGTPVEAIAFLGDQPSGVNTSIEDQTLVAGQQAGGFTIDPYQITKILGLSFISMFIILLAVDLYIIRRRAVYRIATRHLSHMALMAIAASALLNMSPGSIL